MCLAVCLQCSDLLGESGGIFACLKHGEFFVVIFCVGYLLFLSPGVFSLA